MFPRTLIGLVLLARAASVAATEQQRGFTVSVCYSEFPTSSCSPLHTQFQSPILEGPIPADTSRAAQFDEINFRHRFANLPPGNYVVRADGCNPFGCWLDTPVFVVDQDVVVKVQQLGPQTPTPVRSPTPTLTVAASGFRICGMAAERPGGPPPYARAVYFTLHPLELTTISNPAGVFCFDDIAPGDYTISVKEYQSAPTNCTRDGCWETAPVSVVDADVLNLFIVMLPLPTPTATPVAPCLGDGNGDDQVTIEELVGAVNNALSGCPP
jgi:hypothetical protein